MAEASPFTPEQTALHAFWADAWQRCRETLGPSTEQAAVAAEAMMSIASVVFAAFNGWPGACARLRYVADRLERKEREALAGEEQKSPFVLCQERFRQTAQALSDDGLPDEAIVDGLMCLGTNAAVASAGREATIGALEDLIRTVKEKGTARTLN